MTLALTPAAFTDSVGDIAHDLLRLPASHFHTAPPSPEPYSANEGPDK